MAEEIKTVTPESLLDPTEMAELSETAEEKTSPSESYNSKTTAEEIEAYGDEGISTEEQEAKTEEVEDAAGESKNIDINLEMTLSEVSTVNVEEILERCIAPVLSEIKAIESRIDNVEARVSQLRKLADMHERIEYDLNKQINQHKDNFYRRIISPILMEIIELQEEMCQDKYYNKNEVNEVLDEYIESITGILSHYGVSVRFVMEGDKYDSTIHKPLKAVPTDSVELDKTVAVVKKRTVHFVDGVIVSRAGVFVYQYAESKPEQEAANNE